MSKKINLNKVLYLEADINYTTLYFEDGSKEVFSYTLKKFEQLLCDRESFIRVHKSFIVNRIYIQEVREGVPHLVVLNSGKEIPVARRRHL